MTETMSGTGRSTFVAMFKDDLEAEERFLYMTFDAGTGQITHTGPAMTEAEMRADLRSAGVPEGEITEEIDRARKNSF